MSWFKELESEIMSFLDKATEKDIELALERANHAFYKDVDYPILDFHDKLVPYGWSGTVTFYDSFSNKIVLSAQVMPTSQISFDETEVPTPEDSYDYSMAA